MESLILKIKTAVFLVTNPGLPSLLSSSNSMTFHDLFQFSMTLVSAVTFKNFHNCYCFWWYFLPAYLITYLYPFSTPVLTGLGILYMRRRALGRDWSLSYLVLALASAVTNLPNITSVFHHSPWLTIKFHDFLGLENEILKFHDFPGGSITSG